MYEALLQGLSIWGLVFLFILMLRYLVLKDRAVTEPGDQSDNIHKGGGRKSFTDINIIFEKKEKVD